MSSPSRLRLSLGLASLFAIALAMPASAATPAGRVSTPTVTRPATDEEPAPEPAFRFVGYGTDHGVGLSQRGASGRAKAGQTYQEIVEHYFSPAKLKDIDEPNPIIRALVVKSYTTKGAQTVLLRGGVIKSPEEKSKWRVDSPQVADRVFNSTDRLVLIGKGKTGAWTLEVQKSSGAPVVRFTDTDAKLKVTPVQTGAGPAVLQVFIRPSAKFDTYAGVLRIGRVGGKIRIVNHVGVEDFARSVVPQEMGPSNPLEALKAQAVVARSYFLAGRKPANGFLVYDVQSVRDSQSYKGVKGEKPATSLAVRESAGKVVKWKKSGQWVIARTFYHASGGGATEASMNVFTVASGKPGTQIKYLMGGPDVDDDGRPYDMGSNFMYSTEPLTLTQLSKILKKDSRTNVGTLTSWPIEAEGTFLAKRAAALAADADDTTPAPNNRGISGRLTWVTLKGTKNGKAVQKKVAGWLFKQVYNANNGSGTDLRSTLFFREAVD
ncbi:MAG: SpoIID/LytB domain-containing protein [Chloroflexi bacterium]|nr:SpoIID/LytB domain-containing protein [Chloroflexota bacterium]